MRIIERGKLFGKFNWVDLAIVAVALVLLLIGIGSWNILTRKQAPVPWKVGESLQVWAFFDRVGESEVHQLQAGMIELDPAGRPTIEILEIFPAQPSSLNVLVYDELYAPTQSMAPVYRVPSRLILYGDTRPDGYFYCKGKQIRIGTTIGFKTKTFEAEGKIRPGPPQITYVLLLGDTARQVADQMQAGDLIFDHKGYQVGEVFQTVPFHLSKEPSSYLQQYREPKLPTQEVALWVKLNTWTHGNQLLLDTEVLKVGGKLTLYAQDYNFSGTMLTIQHEPPVHQTEVFFETTRIELTTQMIPHSVAQLVRAGDPILNFANQTIGKITAVERLELQDSSGLILDTGGAQLILRSDPDSPPVQILSNPYRLKITATVSAGQGAILAGKQLTLTSAQYELEGMVTHIENDLLDS